MANPQCEDGYTRIANELLSALCKAKLTLYEWRVLMAIIRFTYGYNRKVNQISLRQICSLIDIDDPPSIHKAIKSLEAKGMISVSKQKNRLILGIQKDYEQWTVGSSTNVGPSTNTKLDDQPTPALVHDPTPVLDDQPTPVSFDTPKKDNNNNALYEDAPFSKDNIKDIYKDSIKDNRSACMHRDHPPSTLSQTFLHIVKTYPEFDVRESDLSWFQVRVEGNPQYQCIDLEDELHNWEDWLETEHRKKEKRKSNKFPRSNFKASLTNWLRKALEIKEARQKGELYGRDKYHERHEIYRRGDQGNDGGQIPPFSDIPPELLA